MEKLRVPLNRYEIAQLVLMVVGLIMFIVGLALY